MFGGKKGVRVKGLGLLFGGRRVFTCSAGLGWDVPLILTVLNRDYDRGGTVIPTENCKYEGEHSKAEGFSLSLLLLLLFCFCLGFRV